MKSLVWRKANDKFSIKNIQFCRMAVCATSGRTCCQQLSPHFYQFVPQSDRLLIFAGCWHQLRPHRQRLTLIQNEVFFFSSLEHEGNVQQISHYYFRSSFSLPRHDSYLSHKHHVSLYRKFIELLIHQTTQSAVLISFLFQFVSNFMKVEFITAFCRSDNKIRISTLPENETSWKADQSDTIEISKTRSHSTPKR